MRKNVLDVFHSVTNGDMSADIISPITTIAWLDNVAVQLIWSGTPTGAFFVEGSLDYNAVTHAPGTWVPITLDPAPVASGTADSALIDMTQLSFPYIRVHYVRTSGTGTLNVYVAAKEI